jgi:hypothetical protein
MAGVGLMEWGARMTPGGRRNGIQRLPVGVQRSIGQWYVMCEGDEAGLVGLGLWSRVVWAKTSNSIGDWE